MINSNNILNLNKYIMNCNTKKLIKKLSINNINPEPISVSSLISKYIFVDDPNYFKKLATIIVKNLRRHKKYWWLLLYNKKRTQHLQNYWNEERNISLIFGINSHMKLQSYFDLTNTTMQTDEFTSRSTSLNNTCSNNIISTDNRNNIDQVNKKTSNTIINKRKNVCENGELRTNVLTHAPIVFDCICDTNSVLFSQNMGGDYVTGIPRCIGKNIAHLYGSDWGKRVDSLESQHMKTKPNRVITNKQSKF